MPACGGLSPFPMRMGGGKPRLELVLDHLNRGRGDALDTATDSPVYVENMAHARAITACWLENERLGNQWNPARLTDCLPRWEKICGLVPGPDDSLQVRRARIEALFARIGLLLNRASLTTMLEALVGTAYVDVEYISLDNAVIHGPAGFPIGTYVEGFEWYSTVLHVLVRLQKPDGFTEGEFYEAAGKVTALLDDVLPAWCTFDWYRAPTGGAPVTVIGGPSAGGFYLDQDHNLDNHVFDI